MNDEEIAGLYRRGIEASQSERYEDAIRYFELVHSAAPRHAQVQENLVREYLTLGMERFAGGDLDDAINIWQRALEVDPNDSKARGYLERALRHRDRSQEILGSGR
jgi:tetratricopeptide (TPR) repeat protein